jgi:Ca2+-transporting ATPase
MGQYDDAVSIVIAVIIVSTVAFIQEYKSEKAVEALTQYVTHLCHVVRDDKVMKRGERRK